MVQAVEVVDRFLIDDLILQLAAELNIPLELSPPRTDQIADFEEAGLSSSSRALIPIVKIGDQVIGNGRPGPIIQNLLKAYQDYVGEAVETAV